MLYWRESKVAKIIITNFTNKLKVCYFLRAQINVSRVGYLPERDEPPDF